MPSIRSKLGHVFSLLLNINTAHTVPMCPTLNIYVLFCFVLLEI